MKVEYCVAGKSGQVDCGKDVFLLGILFCKEGRHYVNINDAVPFPCRETTYDLPQDGRLVLRFFTTDDAAERASLKAYAGLKHVEIDDSSFPGGFTLHATY